jgi:hypothetical protein
MIFGDKQMNHFDLKQLLLDKSELYLNFLHELLLARDDVTEYAVGIGSVSKQVRRINVQMSAKFALQNICGQNR